MRTSLTHQTKKVFATLAVGLAAASGCAAHGSVDRGGSAGEAAPEFSCEDVLRQPPSAGAPSATVVALAVDLQGDPLWTADRIGEAAEQAVTAGARLIVVTAAGLDQAEVVYDRDFASTVGGTSDTQHERLRKLETRKAGSLGSCLLDETQFDTTGNPWAAGRVAADLLAGNGTLALVGPFAPQGREWTASGGGDIETEEARGLVAAMIALDGGLHDLTGVAVVAVGNGRGLGDARHQSANVAVARAIAEASGAGAFETAHDLTGVVPVPGA